ncbi:MAG: site-specific integrase [Nitrospirota bacterium]|nr:site-specific integrase [Nitrospirota bacterium]
MRLSYQGRQIRRSTDATDKKLAERIYHKVRVQLAEGHWFPRDAGAEKTVRDLLERYLREHSAPNKAPTTHRCDQSRAQRLIRTFGDLTLQEMRPSLLAAYKATRRAEGAAAKTINHDLSLLGHAFQLAVKEWEWVAENPVHKVSKEKVRNLIERWLTVEEEQRLLAASPGWLQEIIVFAINTGFRQSEILNLQWGQVDLFRRTITLLEQKNGGRDTLPVNATTLEVLKARAKVRSRTTDYVFSNGAGNRRDARDLLRVFYPAMQQADVRRFRFHDLRHTFATRLVQAGADIYTVQKLGRWKTISMVQRYAHHHAESLRAGIEILDRVPAEISTKLAQSAH